MEIKINFDVSKQSIFEDLDKQLKSVYSELDEIQKINVKKQILVSKIAQYDFELSLLQLTSILGKIKEEPASDPQTEELEKPVVDQETIVSDIKKQVNKVTPIEEEILELEL